MLRGENMKIEGKVFKEDGAWISEIKVLDLMTAEKTKKNAIQMMKHSIIDLLNDGSLRITVEEKERNNFLLKSNKPESIVSLILKRQRAKNNLSISDVVKRLGFSSRNAYARYEQTNTKISFSKFLELYNAITNDDIVLTSY
jgi:hypothetical protein